MIMYSVLLYVKYLFSLIILITRELIISYEFVTNVNKNVKM